MVSLVADRATTTLATGMSVITRGQPIRLYGPGKSSIWLEVKAAVALSKKGVLKYTVKPLVDGDSPMESSGVPIQLAEHLSIGSD